MRGTDERRAHASADGRECFSVAWLVLPPLPLYGQDYERSDAAP